ncbi:hypothetical protein PPL_08099 [Heterostelium album PN500]|uniref:Uncharacterized protein n=1 Tax=Heterostelium pallidum (strain ATCC 26659 / Pp 5 / PN500) TaxID=670386 RepID=D3BIM0_HETP5|nr:hypothetical protein PPL_08099 [Heterostelium album PN500]EFA78644.1 hypothetical protein PPL_08099 [Heterostelium album PN500]|eukprot:XP_020430768.1 hypothetical protein PPL_08099 [Heterostelium album PN500]
MNNLFLKQIEAEIQQSKSNGVSYHCLNNDHEQNQHLYSLINLLYRYDVEYEDSEKAQVDNDIPKLKVLLSDFIGQADLSAEDNEYFYRHNRSIFNVRLLKYLKTICDGNLCNFLLNLLYNSCGSSTSSNTVINRNSLTEHYSMVNQSMPIESIVISELIKNGDSKISDQSKYPLMLAIITENPSKVTDLSTHLQDLLSLERHNNDISLSLLFESFSFLSERYIFERSLTNVDTQSILNYLNRLDNQTLIQLGSLLTECIVFRRLETISLLSVYPSKSLEIPYTLECTLSAGATDIKEQLVQKRVEPTLQPLVIKSLALLSSRRGGVFYKMFWSSLLSMDSLDCQSIVCIIKSYLYVFQHTFIPEDYLQFLSSRLPIQSVTPYIGCRNIRKLEKLTNSSIINYSSIIISNNNRNSNNLSNLIIKEIISLAIHHKYSTSKWIVELSTVSKLMHSWCSSILSSSPIPSIHILSEINIGKTYCLFKNAPLHLRNTEFVFIPEKYKQACLVALESLTQLYCIWDEEHVVESIFIEAKNLRNIRFRETDYIGTNNKDDNDDDNDDEEDDKLVTCIGMFSYFDREGNFCEEQQYDESYSFSYEIRYKAPHFMKQFIRHYDNDRLESIVYDGDGFEIQAKKLLETLEQQEFKSIKSLKLKIISAEIEIPMVNHDQLTNNIINLYSFKPNDDKGSIIFE